MSCASESKHPVEPPEPLESPDKTTDQRKYFYSLCLAAKFELAATNPAQSVNIATLYEQVCKQAVPAEQWSVYIRSMLQQSAVVQPKSVSRRQNRRAFFGDLLAVE